MNSATKQVFSAVALGIFAVGVATSAASGSKSPTKATVLLFMSTDCPISQRYSPRINDLYQRYSGQGIEFKALFPNDLESRSNVSAFMADREFKFPYELDLGAEVAKHDGVKAIPTAVLERNGKVEYIGAIDDNDDTSLVHHHYLDDAISSVVNGKPPSLRKTTPVGCVIMPSVAPPAEGSVNYAEHVAPILYSHCTQCHRPGEVAPFSLIGYENAKKWAQNISNATENRQMPPWKAVHGFGDFKDENRLTESEIETLKRWSDASAPRGDEAKEPKAPVYPNSAWALGEPDLIVNAPKPYHVDGDGADVYRNFVIKNAYTTPKYVVALDARPDKRAVVHHIIVFTDSHGAAQKLQDDCKDGQPGYTSSGGGPGFIPDGAFGGWAPGVFPKRAPEGCGFLLKPGQDIVLQVHYHKNGKAQDDQTKVGIYFSDKPVDHIMKILWLASENFEIPAGDPHYKIETTFMLPRDGTVYGVMPHMHYLGKSMKADVIYPDGHTEPLVFVQNWDFNWQIPYQFKEPLHLTKGSKIHIEAYYDNSDKNKFNPNSPPKPVTFGEATTDEMMLLVTVWSPDKTVGK